MLHDEAPGPTQRAPNLQTSTSSQDRRTPRQESPNIWELSIHERKRTKQANRRKKISTKTNSYKPRGHIHTVPFLQTEDCVLSYKPKDSWWLEPSCFLGLHCSKNCCSSLTSLVSFHSNVVYILWMSKMSLWKTDPQKFYPETIGNSWTDPKPLGLSPFS